MIKYWSDHPSIIKIREKLTQVNVDFKFKQVADSDIFKSLINNDGKK